MLQKLKMQLKKVKALVVRRVELTNIRIMENEIIQTLELSNFRSLKKTVQPILELDDKLYSLEYINSGKQVEVHIPFHLIEKINEYGRVQLLINDEKMWINKSESVDWEQLYFIHEGRYFKTTVSKSIKISHRHKMYTFSPGHVPVSSLSADYDTLLCKPENLLGDTEILLINHVDSKERALSTSMESGHLRLSDFEYLPQGDWQLYKNENGALLPLCAAHVPKLDFSSLNHRITLSGKGKRLFLELRPHVLSVVDMTFVKKESNVEIVFATREPLEPASIFVLENIKQKEEIEYPLALSAECEYRVEVPLEDLYVEFSTKRFFVRTTGAEPVKCQFNVEETQLGKERWYYPEVIDSQSVNVSFYRRKDLSLGVRMPQPKLRKQMTKIKGSKIRGQIGSLGRFINCELFLFIEERATGLARELLIEQNFTFDLKKLDLHELKSKGKTVLDFFVVLKDARGEIIRKEKIKYAEADYRKDNYYGYWVQKDREGNEQHFLLTTTPFDNLKIETFVIGKDIVLPADPTKKDDNVWLIGERYDTAQDNGLALFEWLIANTDISAYYVIEEDAIDYESIRHYPNVLRFGSPEHFDIAFRAKVLLGTHDLENLLPYKPAKGFFGYEHTVKVFLQHGVLGRKNVEYHKHNYDIPFDLFVVSSDPEKYDIVVDQFGYEENEVIVTGLARFDKLPKDNETKDILLMPTWRDWIHDDEQFLNSTYYHAYANLINNPELLSLLEQYDVRLNFYPHYRAQSYFNEEIASDQDRVRFIPLGVRHVQDLLIEHALLITDYSTVSFDFTMMNKPVIFYHFDVKRFFKRGILRPVEETFLGKIASMEEELVGLIKDRLEHDFANYDIDISNVIKYQDHHNSRRIYENVVQLLNK